MENEFAGVMDELLSQLSEMYSKTTLDLWFAQLEIVSITDKAVTLMSASRWKKDIISEKYLPVLKEKLSGILGFDVDIKMTSTEDITSPPQSEQVSEQSDEDISEYHARYRASYTFENFVVGKSNELAQRAALATAQHPGELNNPLYLYGPSGMGKTHLMFAIMNEARKKKGQTMLYVTCEEFTNELIDALAQKTALAFRNKYRTVDILLVDDVQFLANKVGIQEEFFHTFNALYDQGKQIIIASDRPPREIDNLGERLKSRFESGLLVDIQAPDLELRLAIFKRKAMDMHIVIPSDVLTFLAENIKINIRQIEGALKKLKAQSLITGKPINLQMTQETLSDFLKSVENDASVIERIFKYILTKYGITHEQLVSPRRSANLTFPRHVAIYLTHQTTKLSYKSIAGYFGRRDHTSIMNSIRVIETKTKESPAFAREMQEAISEILSR